MVNSGGCSGYSYDFNLVDKPAEEDIVVERDGAKLVVDETSLSFLEDCEVDYVEEMIRASFQVVKNKLADNNCGCGSSFSVSAFRGAAWCIGPFFTVHLPCACVCSVTLDR